jgi:hypothetical protein
MKKLTKKQKKQIAVIAGKKDADADLTDMPEVLDWSKPKSESFTDRLGKRDHPSIPKIRGLYF